MSRVAIALRSRAAERGRAFDDFELLEWSIVEMLFAGALLAPVGEIVRRTIARIDLTDLAGLSADVEIERRWRRCARTEIASFVLDPLAEASQLDSSFASACAEVIGVDQRCVPSLLHRLLEAPADVRYALLRELAEHGQFRMFGSCFRGAGVEPSEADRSSALGWWLDGLTSAEQTVGSSLALTHVVSGPAGSVDPNVIARQVSQQPAAPARSRAAKAIVRELRDYVDHDDGARAFLATPTTDRGSVPALPDEPSISRRVDGGRVVLLARTLVELDGTPGSLSLASTAALAARELELADRIAERGLDQHGPLGHGASLALIRAMIARLRDDWVAARSHYLSVTPSRVLRYRCSAVVCGALAAIEFNDENTAMLLHDRGLSEPVEELAAAFRRVTETRTRREGAKATRALIYRLKALLRHKDRDLHWLASS